MNCIKCGNNLSNDDKVCKVCGNVVQNINVEPPHAESIVQNSNQSNHESIDPTGSRNL